MNGGGAATRPAAAVPAIGTVCSLDADLPAILSDYAAGHCGAIDLWLGHAERVLGDRGPEALRELLESSGMRVVAASYQGGLFAADQDAASEHRTLFGHRLDLCRGLGIPVLVVAGDMYGPLAPADLARMAATLGEAARRAGDAGLRLALEFDARASFPDNLQSAVALIEQVSHPALGLCLDWHHFSTGRSKESDLDLLRPDNLFHVQLSDLADVPREMAGDADRILPGEGSSPPDRLLATLARIGYVGAVSIETMNPALWRVPPRQFGEVAMTSLRRLLGQADMG